MNPDTRKALILLAIADLLLAFAVLGGIGAEHRLKARIAALEQQVQQAENRLGALTNLVRFNQVTSPGSLLVTNIITLPP